MLNFTTTENLVADIRNKLTPFWTLTDILRLRDKYPDFPIDETVSIAMERQPIIIQDLKNILSEAERLETENKVMHELLSRAYNYFSANAMPNPLIISDIANYLESDGEIKPTPNQRKYYVPYKGGATHLYTVDEFLDGVKNRIICDSDGIGFWVKNGMECTEGEQEVFRSPLPLDATHVAWYQKVLFG